MRQLKPDPTLAAWEIRAQMEGLYDEIDNDPAETAPARCRAVALRHNLDGRGTDRLQRLYEESRGLVPVG